jgi:hypothetical protein
MKNSDYIDPMWIRFSEPRLDVIRRQLEALMQIVDLEKNGEVVQVDGFRLKNLEDWLVPIHVDATSILSEVACPCDLSCEFCYLKGLPPGEKAGYMRSFQDISTKIRYFSSKKGGSPDFNGIRVQKRPKYVNGNSRSYDSRTPAD